MSEDNFHLSTPAETVMIDQPQTRVPLINQNSGDFVDSAAEAIASRLSLQAEKQNDGQALEGHEVIELQAFSERKAWIEEKIKVCQPNVLV